LGSQVEALTKEKKEKDNVLTNLELVNLKNAFMLNSKVLKTKTKKRKKISWWTKRRNIERIYSSYKQN
jgi:hypothetical protein